MERTVLINTLDNVIAEKSNKRLVIRFVVKYHRSYCNSYTSKQNITCFAQKKTTKEVPDSKSSSVQLLYKQYFKPPFVIKTPQLTTANVNNEG
jgi:hypothetical protein